jgi:hypothetical protein
MISYPVATVEACSLLREKCPELEIDEFYSTSEDGQRFALFHLERKIRITAIERGLELLVEYGVCDVLIAGFDGSGMDKVWFAILERHLGSQDARVVTWVKPGKTRSILPAGSAVDPVVPEEQSRSKRLRSSGPAPSASGIEVDTLRQLLAEKDRLLIEKDTKFELALAEKDKALELALFARNEEVRLILFKREEDEDRLLDTKEAEIHALRVKNEDGDRVILRMAADMECAEARLAAAAEIDAELKKYKGDPVQRVTELVIDLNAERSKVKGLNMQIAASVAASAYELARAEERIRELQHRLIESESSILVTRNEAVIWDTERGRWSAELKNAKAEQCCTRRTIHELQVKLESQTTEVEALKKGVRSMVVAEMEVKFHRTIESLRNELQMEKAGGEYQAKEWKRRTEALRDELRSAQREIVQLKQ